jgi:Mg/Co/Ni transporter MgtE
MITALKRLGPATPVVEVMHRNLPVVGPHESFEEAFRLMEESASPALPVVDRMGRLLGLITPETIGELMLVNSLHPRNGHPAWRHAHAAA